MRKPSQDAEFSRWLAAIILILVIMHNALITSTITQKKGFRPGDKIPLGTSPDGSTYISITISRDRIITRIPVNKELEEETGLIVYLSYEVINRTKENIYYLSYKPRKESQELWVKILYGAKCNGKGKLNITFHDRDIVLAIRKMNTGNLRYTLYHELKHGKGNKSGTYTITHNGKAEIKEYRRGLILLFNDTAKTRINVTNYPRINIIEFYQQEYHDFFQKYWLKNTRVAEISRESNLINVQITKGVLGEERYRIDGELIIPKGTRLYRLVLTLMNSSVGTGFVYNRMIISSDNSGAEVYPRVIYEYTSITPVETGNRLIMELIKLVEECDETNLYSYVNPLPYMEASITITDELIESLVTYTYSSSNGRLVITMLNNNTSIESLVNQITDWLRKYSYNNLTTARLIYRIHYNTTNRTDYIVKIINYNEEQNTSLPVRQVVIVLIVTAAGLASIYYWKIKNKRGKASL